MDPLTAMAASGLRARMESLELLANNIANATTGGYKADREFYNLYSAAESDSGAEMPLIEKPWTDHSQGPLQETGNPLDVALSGRGFFAADGPAGPLYTRNGSFRMGPDGRLVTGEGYPVRGAGGATVQLQSGRSVEIGSDGTIRQDGLAIGRLEIVDFDAGAALSKQGSNYFRPTDPAGRNALPAPASVLQGKLEGSNTGSAETAVRLVSVMRQFEMLQKAASLAADMNRQAVEQVARVGS